MHRFYADPDRTGTDTVCLTAEDARHALTVLRLKTGDQVEVCTDGQRYAAEIVSTENRKIRVRLFNHLPSTEPELSVTLFQGVPKSDKMDWIVQKATELGVSRIVPVNMSRCVAKLAPADCEKKLERWRRIAREAGKQSGRCRVPDVTMPVAAERLGSSLTLPEVNIVPWEESKYFGPLAFHSSHPSVSSLGILIGPEGGIEPGEIDAVRSLGFIPVTLGKRILRTETAGLAALSVFMGLYGEME